MKFNYGKIFLLGFGFFGTSVIWSVYNAFVPIFLANKFGLSAGLIGGLASLRMLKALFASVVSASVGGGGGMAQALIECAEALFGMLLAALAMPLSAWFLGAC